MRHHCISGIALAAISLVVGAGCGNADITTSGNSSFMRPSDQGGRTVPPQQSREDLRVNITLQGTGDFTPVQRSLCALLSGEFSMTATTSGRIGSDGRYTSSYSAEANTGQATNPACGAVQDLRVRSVTAVTLAASIPTSGPNCDGYCQARADASCESAPDRASCMSQISATCMAECSQATRITGTGSASASALAATNGKLGSQGNVDTEVELVFTTLE
jgi:hypothetical protein